MLKDMYEILAVPARLNIMLTVAGSGSISIGKVCETFSDIPQETVLEDINILINAEALNTEEQKDEGGNVETMLSLNNAKLRRHIIPKSIYDYVP